MSIPLPPLYHWSPRDRRDGIIRRGLVPQTPTLVDEFATEPEGPRNLQAYTGQRTAKAICLGTTPSHAWSLCGAIWGGQGEAWDLWQVTLDDGDDVYPLRFTGPRLDEVRVLSRIPKGRVWHVGSRIIGRLRWAIAYEETA